jgi:heme/copper-type cytochrome/quinol oxidase subunit 2
MIDDFVTFYITLLKFATILAFVSTPFVGCSLEILESIGHEKAQLASNLMYSIYGSLGVIWIVIITATGVLDSKCTPEKSS